MGKPKVYDDLYLMAIEQLCCRTGRELARTGQIGKRLGISDAVVSTKLKQLYHDGLIVYHSHAGAKLTEQGRDRLERALRRLQLIEMWLSTSLNLERVTLAEDALRLEWAVSEKLINAIDSALGHPPFDSLQTESDRQQSMPLASGQPSAEDSPVSHSG